MKRFTFFSLALLLLVVSCGTTTKSTKGQLLNLESTKWQVERLNGRTIEPKSDSFTIEFVAEGRIAAKGSCNIIVGGYSQDVNGESDKLKLSPMGITRTACPDMATESEYVAALESVTSYGVVEGELILYSESGEIIQFLRLE